MIPWLFFLRIFDKIFGIWKNNSKNKGQDKYVEKLEKINEMQRVHGYDKIEPQTDQEWDQYFRTGKRPDRVRDSDKNGEVPKVPDP